MLILITFCSSQVLTRCSGAHNIFQIKTNLIRITNSSILAFAIFDLKIFAIGTQLIFTLTVKQINQN